MESIADSFIEAVVEEAKKIRLGDPMSGQTDMGPMVSKTQLKKVEDKVYIKRLTLIVEKSIIKHFFYPVFPPDLHVKEVLQWLDSNR